MESAVVGGNVVFDLRDLDRARCERHDVVVEILRHEVGVRLMARIARSARRPGQVVDLIAEVEDEVSVAVVVQTEDLTIHAGSTRRAADIHVTDDVAADVAKTDRLAVRLHLHVVDVALAAGGRVEVIEPGSSAPK